MLIKRAAHISSKKVFGSDPKNVTHKTLKSVLPNVESLDGSWQEAASALTYLTDIRGIQ